MKTTEPFNVAIIGYGFSARIFHIPLLLSLPTLHLYGIVQRSPSTTSNSLTDHPETKQWHSTEAMLADPDVDLVVITTLPESHFALASAALKAGKHVVVEKPFAPTSDECTKLGKLAKESGKLLSVYQNRRWDADFVTAKQLIEDGSLGRVFEFHTHFDRYDPNAGTSWRENKEQPAAGPVFDLGTHLLDQVVHQFGMPKTVYGVVQDQRTDGGQHGEPGDSFSAVLRYESGLTVHASASVLSVEAEQPRFWIRGSRGSWVKKHLDCQEEHLLQGIKADEERFGVENEERWGTLTKADAEGKFVKEEYETMKPPTWTEFYRRMASAMKGEGDVPVSAEDAAAVIRLVELIIESSRTGQVVDV